MCIGMKGGNGGTLGKEGRYGFVHDIWGGCVYRYKKVTRNL